MIYVNSKEKDLNTPQMPLTVKSCIWPLYGLHSRFKGPKNVSGDQTSLASLQFSSCFTKSCLFPSVCKKKGKGKEIGQQLPLKHTDRFLVEMFHNYTFKECISVEKLRLWLLILTKTLFLMTILIKLTLGNIFIKVKKSARAAPLSQNS